MTQSGLQSYGQNGHVEVPQTPVRPPAIQDTATETLHRLRLIELTVDVLIAQAKIGKLWIEGYREAIDLLKTLPLPSDVFDLATKRIENALCYCQLGEFGAAAFELRMLRGPLQEL